MIPQDENVDLSSKTKAREILVLPPPAGHTDRQMCDGSVGLNFSPSVKTMGWDAHGVRAQDSKQEPMAGFRTLPVVMSHPSRDPALLSIPNIKSEVA